MNNNAEKKAFISVLANICLAVGQMLTDAVTFCPVLHVVWSVGHYPLNNITIWISDPFWKGLVLEALILMRIHEGDEIASTAIFCTVKWTKGDKLAKLGTMNSAECRKPKGSYCLQHWFSLGGLKMCLNPAACVRSSANTSQFLQTDLNLYINVLTTHGSFVDVIVTW